MMLIATALQNAGIKFIEASGSHRDGRMRIKSVVVNSDADLMKFAAWAGENDIEFDNARVATPAEIKHNWEQS